MLTRAAVLFFVMTTGPAAGAETSLKILGAPGAVKAVAAQQEKLERVTESKIEFIEQPPFSALPALKRRMIDAVAMGGSVDEFFDSAEAKKADPGPQSDYDSIVFSSTKLMAVLNPDNPVKSLTKDQ